MLKSKKIARIMGISTIAILLPAAVPVFAQTISPKPGEDTKKEQQTKKERPVAASCASQEETMKDADAWGLVIFTVQTKRAECGGAPPQLLPVPNKPKLNAVNACALAIIDQPCPFTEYPLLCLGIFGADIPGFSR